MRWMAKNWMPITFVAFVLLAEWLTQWQPLALECHRRGGSYSPFEGSCERMTFQIIFTKHDLK